MSAPARMVAAIHDLSGVGRCALTVALPVLSALGLQVCPAPTAVLSAHTAFEGIAALDLTDFLGEYFAHWKRLGLRFDAVYGGYLASPRQAEIVADFLRDQPSALRVLDPVMGDDGALYAGMPGEMAGSWRMLASQADVITPNLTEYALLTGEPHSLAPRTEREAGRMLEKLLSMGAKSAVITSVPLANGPANAYMATDGALGLCRYERLNAHYPGTGDLFASVLTGALLLGDGLASAVQRATDFTRLAIARSMEIARDVNYGVDLEPILSKLKRGCARPDGFASGFSHCRGAPACLQSFAAPISAAAARGFLSFYVFAFGGPLEVRLRTTRAQRVVMSSRRTPLFSVARSNFSASSFGGSVVCSSKSSSRKPSGAPSITPSLPMTIRSPGRNSTCDTCGTTPSSTPSGRCPPSTVSTSPPRTISERLAANFRKSAFLEAGSIRQRSTVAYISPDARSRISSLTA